MNSTTESGIKKVTFSDFTAFTDLQIDFCSGINVLIGENGTGKTHIMKALFAACDIVKTGDEYAEKLVRVFLPSKRRIGRLVHRHRQGRKSASIVIERNGSQPLSITFSTVTPSPAKAKVTGEVKWRSLPIEAAYIPVKEMLANAPGFRSLHKRRELHFEEIYADILERAYLPALRGAPDEWRQKLAETMGRVLKGSVHLKEEEFFLGNLEFTLLSEGIRKLALLSLLIQNGILTKGSVLFWDEPEANLNPKMLRTVVEMLFLLQRNGVQIFIATHDYIVLSELDLQRKPEDKLVYHALFRDAVKKDVRVKSTSDYLAIEPSAIADTFSDLYDRILEKDMGDAS